MQLRIKQFALACLLLVMGGMYMTPAAANDLSRVVSPGEVKAGLESAILESVTRVVRVKQSFNSRAMVQAVSDSIDWNSMYRHYLKVARHVLTPHELKELYASRLYVQSQGRSGRQITGDMSETLQNKGDKIYSIMINRLITQIGQKINTIKVAYTRKANSYTARNNAH